jgi:hypothetical protein
LVNVWYKFLLGYLNIPPTLLLLSWRSNRSVIGVKGECLRNDIFLNSGFWADDLSCDIIVPGYGRLLICGACSVYVVGLSTNNNKKTIATKKQKFVVVSC